MHTPTVSYFGDLNLAKEALSGDEHAAGVFVGRFWPELERHLVERCRRSDARSTEKAREIAADVISDCFGAKNRPRGEAVLLKLYHGQGPLNGWLRGVAYSRLKSWWASREFGGMISLPDAEVGLERCSKQTQADPEVVKILRIALENAFRQLEPYQLLFLRLVYLHGVRREHLARSWGCHPAKITRDTGAAVQKIRKLTLQYLKVLDPAIELRWEDCQAICDKDEGLLTGATSDGGQVRTPGLDAIAADRFQPFQLASQARRS
jgi:DNA-directed RNA polymerase specialized sigma24 family protein